MSLSTSSGCETSHRWASAEPPAALMFETVCSSASSATSAHRVCAPAVPNAIAMARPIPVAAPVTTTTFPVKSMSFVLSAGVDVLCPSDDSGPAPKQRSGVRLSFEL